MNCPDCEAALPNPPSRCRCGWVAFGDTKAATAALARYCNCGQRALPGRQRCQDCEAEIRHEASRAANEAKGLHTVDDMKAYCRRLLKTGLSTPPSFERWALNLKQRAVDLMRIQDGKGDREALARLRRLGVIDERGQLIPIEERPAAMAAAQARARAERASIEAELREHGIVQASEEGR